jgi:phosphotransferase system enzyme I (PtsP)
METDHVRMLYDISELNNLFIESENIETFLQKIVAMVADHMLAEVSSIYMYNEPENELVLKATIGLKQEFIDKIKLKNGEGLVGLAMKELNPVCEKIGKDNPQFKYFPETGEDKFNAFLAVPIARGKLKIGVLVVQRGGDAFFTDKDIIAMQATASQLVTIIENAGLILLSHDAPVNGEKEVNLEELKFIKGKSASKGFAFSPAVVLRKGINYKSIIKRSELKHYSLDDFERAVADTEEQLETMQEMVEEKLSDAASLIFASHLLILKDRGFVGGMTELIKEGKNPPVAVLEVLKKYTDIFAASPNPLIKEKVQDIEDLSLRILDNIFSVREERKYQNKVIIANELYPSDLLKISTENVSGIILESGGVTSHVSILARSLEIPLVFVEKPELLLVPENTKVLIDADLGNVYINPTDDVVATFREKNRAQDKLQKMDDFVRLTPETKDGTYVSVKANVNLLSDIKENMADHIDGVGLYRTEFPFLIRNGFPSEEEQFIIYEKLIEKMKGKPVTFRTLDIGGDKVLSYYQIGKEENPFLGMRSIRFSLLHREIFTQQIRAILRAGFEKSIRIMFPMISSVDEFNHAKEIVSVCMQDLERESVPYNRDPEIGVMIELPSIINLIEEMAEAADFFSVGTNDLIQYTLAVDRTNEKVADLYIPHHPAVLRSLKRVADAAAASNIDASICGDMANNKQYIPFLIGAGFKTLSVDSIYIPRLKKIITELSMKEAIAVAEDMLSRPTIKGVEEVLKG